MEDIHGIAIVGGGISGLATSLALHRKGIRSLVLEKSETLRAEGVAITIHANGWRALDSLGVGAELRELATLITTPKPLSREHQCFNQVLVAVRDELRCLTRKDLIETLANSLPSGAIRFGCHIVAIDAADASSHGAVLTTVDGSTIKAKVLIGCDGANSVVAKFLGLSMPVQLPCLDILGLTRYPQGHPFGSEYLNILGKGYAFGQIPITENIVHFYVNMPNPSSTATNKDAGRGKDYVLRKLQECQCPAEIVEKIRGIDPESMKILTKIWYMPPWRLVLGRFQRGTVTLAGDAMHVMGPFNGQGGSVALEDAVVLARSLSMAVPAGGGVAIGMYVRERRPRVAKLSLECFVIGTLLGTKSLVKRLICVAVLAVLGNMSGFKANYDCGPL
ncbi:hypothetical protein HU200_038322 [Digitaria exilis]|uniref:FAD-binding domain-containing protein n=1 Tax=Digitaria exilis TaxID=1010633 RepID=A0A835BCS3_9POAL|nr:hypothetical protein HU200_038322 [Digitaria exilis]